MKNFSIRAYDGENMEWIGRDNEINSSFYCINMEICEETFSQTEEKMKFSDFRERPELRLKFKFQFFEPATTWFDTIMTTVFDFNSSFTLVLRKQKLYFFEKFPVEQSAKETEEKLLCVGGIVDSIRLQLTCKKTKQIEISFFLPFLCVARETYDDVDVIWKGENISDSVNSVNKWQFDFHQTDISWNKKRDRKLTA